MLTRSPINLNDSVEFLKAVGEPTRLRLLALLSKGDLTVTDLIDILGQSQPRISRHLKLLCEAGLLERYQEGAWAYFRMADEGQGPHLVGDLLARLDFEDPQMLRDMDRLENVRRKRAERADGYFSSNAAQWEQLRSLHIDESQVEQAMIQMIGKEPVQSMLDLGTGTGRLLEVFSETYVKAVGVDASRDMLAIARANMDKAGLTRVQVRQGDITMLPTGHGQFDLVTLHQVLHYLHEPSEAIAEAAKALAPGGRLMVADFAPHKREELREQHAHARLGFSHEQIAGWLEDAGLEVVEIRDLKPKTKSTLDNELLTVTVWLAKDQRIQIAETINTTTGTA